MFYNTAVDHIGRDQQGFELTLLRGHRHMHAQHTHARDGASPLTRTRCSHDQARSLSTQCSIRQAALGAVGSASGTRADSENSELNLLSAPFRTACDG